MKIKNFLLLMTIVSFANFSNAQLIHRWKLDGDLNDAITGKTGTVVDTGVGAAGIAYVNDPVRGTVLKLDGSAYVALPDSLFEGVSDFTITCWYKFDGNNAGNWQHVYSFGSNNAAPNPWNIIYYTPNDGALSRFTFGSHGTWLDITKADTTRNVWEYVSLIKKGQSLLAYKNDELLGRIDTLTSDIFKGSGIFPDTANNIGWSWWGDENYHGLVSDLRIYDKAIGGADLILAETITISGPDSVMVDSTIKLTVTLTPDDVTVTIVGWATSDATIATATNGNVKGKAAGTVTITATTKDGSNLSATKTIKVVEPETPVGVNEATTSAFTLYPNPATDVLQISNSSVIQKVIISNIAGKDVMTLKNNSSQVSVNIESLNAGVYIIRSYDNNGKMYINKLLKK